MVHGRSLLVELFVRLIPITSETGAFNCHSTKVVWKNKGTSVAKHGKSRDNRSVMPLDGLGDTRATLHAAARVVCFSKQNKQEAHAW